MKVANVLERKGDQVVTTTVNTTVSEATKVLASARIGVLVVVDSMGYLLGTISESDIVRGIALSGQRFLDIKVETAMNHKPLTCGADDDIREVEVMITRERTRQLPVVDLHGRVIGIISIGDVLKSRLDVTSLERDVLRDFYLTRH